MIKCDALVESSVCDFCKGTGTLNYGSQDAPKMDSCWACGAIDKETK